MGTTHSNPSINGSHSAPHSRSSSSSSSSASARLAINRTHSDDENDRRYHQLHGYTNRTNSSHHGKQQPPVGNNGKKRLIAVTAGGIGGLGGYAVVHVPASSKSAIGAGPAPNAAKAQPLRRIPRVHNGTPSRVTLILDDTLHLLPHSLIDVVISYYTIGTMVIMGGYYHRRGEDKIIDANGVSAISKVTSDVWSLRPLVDESWTPGPPLTRTRDATPHAVYDTEKRNIAIIGSIVEMDTPPTIDHLPIESLLGYNHTMVLAKATAAAIAANPSLLLKAGGAAGAAAPAKGGDATTPLLVKDKDKADEDDVAVPVPTLPPVPLVNLPSRWLPRSWPLDVCLDRCEASCAVINGNNGKEIHLFGGYARDGAPIPPHIMFDGSSWSTRTPMPSIDGPFELRNGMASVAYGNTICIGGGSFYKGGLHLTMSQQFHQYNTLDDTWVELPSFRHKRCSSRMINIGDNILLLGGMGPEGHLLNTVDRYSRRDRRWYPTDITLPQQMASYAIGMIGDILMIAGGWVSEPQYGYSRTAWCIRITDLMVTPTPWIRLPDLPAPIKHMAYVTIQ